MALRHYKLLILPIFAALLCGSVLIAAPGIVGWFESQNHSDAVEIVHAVAESVLWLSLAWFAARVVDVFLWRRIADRTGRPAPKLLVAVVRLLIFLGAAAFVVAVVFHQPLTGLAVSSGVLGIVLGFALQKMISDFFSGIALSMEHPFRVGDWIEIEGVAGRVTETNWRATRMVTLEHVTVVVPNSYLSEHTLRNYNLPGAHFRTQVAVGLEYGVPIPDAKRVLLAATKGAEGVLSEPAPDVMLTDYGDNGIIYTIRFFVGNYENMTATRDRVMTGIGRHLYQAGFGVPYPKRDVYYTPMPPREISRKADRRVLLGRVELFESLEAEDIDALSAALTERRCLAGQDIVHQGEPGASLFVVVDGLLEARVKADGQMITVGRIGAGDYFGEMSLLTGVPRGATVVAVTDVTLYELAKDVISPILQRRPQLAEVLSHRIAFRRIRNDQALASKDDAVKAAQQRSFATELLGKIRDFFSLGD